MPIILSDSKTLLLEAKRLRAKRRFGQNFLINPEIPKAIVSAMHLDPNDTVVEIGPGAGTLTEHLLYQAGHVFAVEMERDIVRTLEAKYNPSKHPLGEKLSVIVGDFLRFDPNTLIQTGQLTPPFPVVGNIPYNITTPILFHLCGEVHQSSHPWRQWVRHITLMIQKEVADRVVAAPGGKAYNHLSIAIQLWFDARLVLNVPPQSFYPAPKVNSAVVQLMPRLAPLYPIDDYGHFARLIRCAFAQRRKTIRNSLLGSGFAPADILDRMFETANDTMAKNKNHLTLSLASRAETISIEGFAELANAYSQINSKITKETPQDSL
ncbi:MAG: 16S rRNA (adenine(1518)-N(6)/adenine(1519)-N(6))-dimethyltransferase RsmA [Vampirovibrionales bacterium]|nr:16S rRNA (adenine(1518)-N(6)/adenine(1519)-N(6))-dimethyltransferase RsmA [Vampirovibrionales bacterium]